MAELIAAARIRVLHNILKTKYQPKLHGTRGLPSGSANLDLEVEPAPQGCSQAHLALLTPEALEFLTELVSKFQLQVQELHRERDNRRFRLRSGDILPSFPPPSPASQEKWLVAPLPARVHNRHLDLGDVSPANLRHFTAALAADVQGIQVDFDDGHCPSWPGQLRGLHTVVQAAQGRLPHVKPLLQLPVLMLRPRAWNMTEQHVTLNGQGIPGALFDFGLLMFHIGTTLYRAGCGPFFYLSKLEGASEARLWNQIFVWTQTKLSLPQGSIKACVLIENILSAFEMEDILYELRDHSLGLNCGIWDYAASIINKLGHRSDFVLPDRNRYVDVRQHFLRSYMALVVSTCHKRGAPATGGMAALLVPDNDSQKANEVIQKVVAAKKYEIEMGLDGFMVYDTKLVPHMNKLWQTASFCGGQSPAIAARDLLLMPPGGVTQPGLVHNIAVAVLFIAHWLLGHGHFAYMGAVEDSATAEISRSQVWQWVYHNAQVEGQQIKTSLLLVRRLVHQFVQGYSDVEVSRQCLQDAANVLLDLVATREPPEFITSFLNDSHTFQALSSKYSTG